MTAIFKKIWKEIFILDALLHRICDSNKTDKAFFNSHVIFKTDRQNFAQLPVMRSKIDYFYRFTLNSRQFKSIMMMFTMTHFYHFLCGALGHCKCFSPICVDYQFIYLFPIKIQSIEMDKVFIRKSSRPARCKLELFSDYKLILSDMNTNFVKF